jgi:hypothetical protein
MSNFRHTYAWIGWIFVSEDAYESERDHNVVAIPKTSMLRLYEDARNLTLPPDLEVQQLGFEQAPWQGEPGKPDTEKLFLAVGHSFVHGWRWYGTIVPHCHGLDTLGDTKWVVEALKAYGVSIQEESARSMVGCASEH